MAGASGRARRVVGLFAIALVRRNRLFPLKVSEQAVTRSRNVRIHLERRPIGIARLDHCEDATVLVGDHLGIEKVMHLNLRHAQVRLADDELVKPPKSRTARCGNQGAMEIDVRSDELVDPGVGYRDSEATES